MSALLRGLTAALVLLLLSSHALAHKPSDSYLQMAVDSGRPGGRWDIALRDLNDVVGLDANADGAVTWGELLAAKGRVEAYARTSLRATTRQGACSATFGELAVVEHSDGAYATLSFSLSCPGDARALRLHYDLLFAFDAQHRGIVRTGDGTGAPIIFTKERRDAELSLATGGPGRGFFAMVTIGVEHILHGYDHLLFLITLLLPSVLRRETGRWVAVADFRSVLTDVLRIVTAFTLAHSLTLGLSAAHLVSLPSRFVESAIALSVLLAALNNVFPLLSAERWAAAFALGLLHGFGFAATLSDVGLAGVSFLRTLLGFNLGVELGQLAVVLLVLPLIHGLRRSPRYQPIGLRLGSTLVLLVSTVWFVERAFDLKIIS